MIFITHFVLYFIFRRDHPLDCVIYPEIMSDIHSYLTMIQSYDRVNVIIIQSTIVVFHDEDHGDDDDIGIITKSNNDNNNFSLNHSYARGFERALKLYTVDIK